MKSRRISLLFLILSLVLFWACVGSESFKMGQDMAKDKRWDEAISYYEKALKENPDSNEYKNALTVAKQESAKVHLDKAKSMLVALPKQDLPGIEQVMKEADIAFGLDPPEQCDCLLS